MRTLPRNRRAPALGKRNGRHSRGTLALPGKSRLKSILFAEDDPDALVLVSSNLRSAGYHLVTAPNGRNALKQAREMRPALILLDLAQPEMPGLEVCKLLKRDHATSSIPIIMLSTNGDATDRILGLEAGADDCIPKPFSPKELVLRVKSILRRTKQKDIEPEEQAYADVTVNHSQHEVTVAGQRVALTFIEYQLLATLLDRRGQAQSREALLHDVWGYQTIEPTRTVAIHVGRLREKLGANGPQIETVRGFGYRLAATQSSLASSTMPQETLHTSHP